MQELLSILTATFIISLGGLMGVFTLGIKEKLLNRWLHGLVAIAAGAMLANTFLVILPEAIEKVDPHVGFQICLLAFVGFFLLEKILHWRHCHDDTCEVHSFGYMNLIGDALHNFIDGMVIAAAFLTSPALGIATTLAVALHEIPQEISDYGVLLYAGFSKGKALLANFGVALGSILGGVVGYLASETIEGIEAYLLLAAAASFLYISASDLMPELRRPKTLGKLLQSFALFMLGIIMIWLIPHNHDTDEEHQQEETSHIETIDKLEKEH